MTSQTKKGNSFVKQAGILAMAGIICRIIGLLYRSPLTGIIGETGNGFYAPAYRIYQMILLISSYSIPSAVSKVISQRLAVHQYKNAQRIFRCSLIYVMIVGGAASVFAFAFADLLSPGKAAMVLRMLAPTIFFSGLLGVLRGYFQATKTMVPTSISQIMEQILNAVVSIGAAFLLMKIFADTDDKTRAAWGAVGSALGTGIGVLTALAFMFLLYEMNKKVILDRVKRDTTPNVLTDKQIFRIILSMVTPVILSTFAYNASALINQTLYLQVMEKYHGERLDDILIINGIYDTQAVGLSNIPIAIASAMAAAILPSIAGTFEKRKVKEVNGKIHTAIKTIMFIAIPAAVGMMVLARPIVWLLYPTTAKSSIDMGGALLAALGLSIVFYSLSTLSNAILQAVGKATKPVTNACIALAVQTAIAAVLLFVTDWGIYCLPIAVTVYSLMMCILNGITVKKVTGYRQEWVNTFLLPFWASVVMGVITAGVYYGLMQVLEDGWMTNAVSIAAAVVLGMLVYFAAALKFGAMKKNELQAMPGGRTMVVLAQRMHLLKK
ncbi:MAG: polysaccharide biosynthesis protein [Lachnospiraceae bacterium]|nr:polysaccharide biosynthesis protein [Lachnospiraceae bacterium]